MKEEIVKLAKEKGFLLDINHITCFSSNYVIDIYYLWLCELQKWLRDERSINMDIEFDNYQGIDEYFCTVRNPISSYSGLHYSYEDALEKGCFEALKLVK